MMNFLRKQMKWVMAIIVVAFLLSTFLMYEGRSTRHTPTVNADGTMSDYEVAQINGRSLMRSELERRLRDYLSSYSSRSAESLDMPAIYQAVLNQTILESQLAKEVEDSGIRVSDAEADQAMKNQADMYYPTRETFYQALANSGIKVEDYKRNLARQIALERLLSNVIGEVEVSEDKAVEFYDTMKNLIYARPEGFMIHAANFHKKEDAEVLRGKLTAGESWDVIVSNNELASNDVINITREPVFLPSSALTTGAFSILASLDVGEVSPVFEVTSDDFAVGLKTQHVEASVTPYDELSSDIRTLLLQQEQRKRVSEYEESLIKKAQVVINDESLFARTAVTSPDESMPELVINDIVEVSADSEPETGKESESESGQESKEEVKEEPKEETKEESVTEPETEEVKTEEPVKEEAKTEDAATEAKAEEPVKDEAKQEVKPAETETEGNKAEEPIREEPVTLNEEAKSEETSSSEEAKEAEEPKTEEPITETETEEPATEAKTEESVNEEARTEEVKPEEAITIETTETIPAESESESKQQEETKPEETAEVADEAIEEAVTEATTETVTEASPDVEGAAEKN